MLTAALSAPSCVRFENFPTINAPSNDPALYRVKNKDWKAYTERARTDVRGAHFDWLLEESQRRTTETRVRNA